MTTLVDKWSLPLDSALSSGCHIIGKIDFIDRYGIYLNRTMEESNARKNYLVEW